jgi:type VI protein secretion system component VasK
VSSTRSDEPAGTGIATTLGDRAWVRQALRWWVFLVMWAAVACSHAVVVFWSGHHGRGMVFEELLEDLQRPDDKPATVERMRQKLVDGIRAVKEASRGSDRSATIANLAIGHLRKELDQ